MLDDEQVATIGEGAGRFPVAATINGHTWRTSVSRMRGEYLLGLNKDVRAGCGAEAGDEVTVAIALDTAPREVDMPAALTAALDADPARRAAFDALSYTARKEHARQIAEAKQDATRDRRLQKILDALA